MLPESSIDSVVTDPPYGLSFMGKHWDYDLPSVDIWRECLRVLKPGGHLLSFAGTRTHHRICCGIEDAGFEIRDMIAWVYGSGFPKSLDVSKAIDKAAGAEREVVGPRANVHSRGQHKLHEGWKRPWQDDPKAVVRSMSETAPATDAAKQWQGWGTALKPAFEPITVARKPIIGTVAENVLAHGTGALNIDGCRVTNNLPTCGPAATLETWEHDQNLCATCAAHAGQNAKHSTRGTVESTAPKSAAPTTNARAKINLAGIGKMDTGCSAGLFPAERDASQTGDASLNTSASGAKAAAPFPKEAASTTLTGMDSTTESKTCASCGAEITPDITCKSISARPNPSPQEQSSNGSAEPAARWPSNMLHDGSEEVMEAFAKFGESKSRASDYDWVESGNDNPVRITKNIKSGIHFNDTGTAARFFYTAKASKQDRDEWLDGMNDSARRMFASGGRTMMDGKWIETNSNPRARKNHHPTVKPTDLMRYLVRLVTPPGGTVLDPFMGSGSTGKAAMLEGFKFIGIERDAEYFEIAKARNIRWQGDLFL
jgi:DNA modification methylase